MISAHINQSGDAASHRARPPPLSMPGTRTSTGWETDSHIMLESSIPYSATGDDDPWALEVEQLQELARSVRGNLRLRPIRSFVDLKEGASAVSEGGGEGEGGVRVTSVVPPSAPAVLAGQNVSPPGEDALPVPTPLAVTAPLDDPPSPESAYPPTPANTHPAPIGILPPVPALPVLGDVRPVGVMEGGGIQSVRDVAAQGDVRPMFTLQPLATSSTSPPQPQLQHVSPPIIPHPATRRPPSLPTHPQAQSPFALALATAIPTGTVTPTAKLTSPLRTGPPPSAFKLHLSPATSESDASSLPSILSASTAASEETVMRPVPEPPCTAPLSRPPRRPAPVQAGHPHPHPSHPQTAHAHIAHAAHTVHTARTPHVHSAPLRTSFSTASPPPDPSGPQPLSASSLLSLLPTPFPSLNSPFPQPLIIDTRPLPSFLSLRLRQSINLAIPSLILKRYAKQGQGMEWDLLRGYVTTESGRESWDALLGSALGRTRSQRWNGDILIYDEEMDESTRASVRALSQAWTLATVLVPLVGAEHVYYLVGGFSALRTVQDALPHLVAGENYLDPTPQQQQYASPMLSGQELTVGGSPRMQLTPNTGRSSIGPGTAGTNGTNGSAGLFSLRTDVASARRRVMLEVDPQSPVPTGSSSSASASSGSASASTSGSASHSSLSQGRVLHSPAPIPAVGTLRPLGLALVDAPSPPPSAACFPQPPRRLGNSAPGDMPMLGLALNQPLRSPLPPKLQLRTAPIRSNTVPVPPSPGLLRITPPSPNAPGLQPPKSPLRSPLPLPLSPISRGPASPLPPPSPHLRPHTAPFDYPPRTHSDYPHANAQLPQTPTSSSAPQPFTVSEILPGFLYLGPEPSTDEEVEQLLDLGIKRILNMAEECDDDQGLGLRRKFEMYERVPMRDTVDEENIGRGVRAACLFLDDARLHDSPTYVHCKAGKSRSVTVVMGYLIHAHSWPLSKAYAYVMEKRQGISPNIGFVSELMKFEESQLGTKSVGVGEEGGNHARSAKPVGLGLRRIGRGAGARESLPPLSRGASVEDVLALTGTRDEADLPKEEQRTPVSTRLGDAATEKEVKDADGRYVHARKVPVDRRTLQPQRRVSKAGLESAWLNYVRPTA
ncbi:hypothetical protein DACRYDRAFT_117059 [Dacryopinax primogenitus]|uniref:protein-tyrosine-phosphatase n=1 Tax=Dacryopinax primogenitus (strain DJM 731) TaxID=1858805 RepID=M5FW27_DACPD|nr:uncharacterized protein DACRYDRAFT_117059 [Dacryopinax primogenitus]EJU00569.1 hypothetical protein DACRYDRAFT_117059 [Dacryopinax primogenitus]